MTTSEQRREGMTNKHRGSQQEAIEPVFADERDEGNKAPVGSDVQGRGAEELRNRDNS